MKSIHFIFMKFFLCLSILFSAIAQAGTISITYYHSDVTGSPVAATNEAGDEVWRKDYTPYGEANGKDRDNKVGYTGHTEDANGLVYAGARYYDPSLGRFLGVDPVGFSESNPMSFNRYAYANNNPLKYIDPDGRAPALILEGDEGVGSMQMGFHGAGGSLSDVIGMKPIGGGAGKGISSLGEAGGARAGKVMTQAGKQQVRAENAAVNNGQTTCVGCGQTTVKAEQSKKGVTPPKNETHVDHIIPKSKGGDGSPSNGQILCRECNLKKSDK